MAQGSTIVFLVFCALVGAFALSLAVRRVLGTHVGFLRSYLGGIVAVASLWPVTLLFAQPVGMVDADGNLIGSAPLAVFSALLALLWTLVAALACVVVLEALAPTGSVPSPLELMRMAVAAFRRTRRLAQFARIVSRTGLSHAMRFGPDSSAFAPALVEALNRFGVTFVKLGQLLSTRQDLLPDATTRALASLQSDAEPVPTDVIKKVIARDLGADVDELFTRFEDRPLAAASVAQVHDAVMKDGDSVVVKVQRPSARAQVRDDFDILRHASRMAEARFPWARRMGLTSLIEDLMESVQRELDYRQEAENTRALEISLRKQPGIRVPHVRPEFTSPRVLVMSKLEGVPLSHAQERVAQLDEADRLRLARDLIEALIDGIFVHGVFHSDLHPGNIMLLDDGRLGLLDFGSIGVLDSDTRQVLAALIYGVMTDDAITATDALFLAFDVPDETDLDQLRRQVGREIALVQNQDQMDAALFGRLFAIAREHGIGVPSGIAAAFRTLAAVEKSLLLLHPRISLLTAARDRIGSVLRDLHSPRRLAEQAMGSAAILTSVLRRMPLRAEEVTAALADGTFTVDARPFADPTDRAWMRSLVDDGIASILAVAGLITSAQLITSDSGPMLTGSLSLYAMAGVALGFGSTMLAFRAIVRVFRR